MRCFNGRAHTCHVVLKRSERKIESSGGHSGMPKQRQNVVPAPPPVESAMDQNDLCWYFPVGGRRGGSHLVALR